MPQHDYPHRRYNPLTGDWVLVTPRRIKQPLQELIERSSDRKLPVYDPACTLCPGNSRTPGRSNPDYRDVFAFTDDNPSLIEDCPESAVNDEELIVAHSEKGTCRVLCLSPRHDVSLSVMRIVEIRVVIDAWAQEYSNLGRREHINYVQIFENRGEPYGNTNPHPHCLIWANETVPPIPGKKSYMQKEYLQYRGRVLLMDYLELELKNRERVLHENDSFVLLVPFWAVWPYEVMILPRKHVRSVAELEDSGRHDLAEMISRTGVIYDNLFETDCPYSMGIHQAPTDGEEHDEWQFHMSYYPPLLRSAADRKSMTGYEMFAMPQRDLTPEEAADRLRDLPTVHYSRKS